MLTVIRQPDRSHDMIEGAFRVLEKVELDCDVVACELAIAIDVHAKAVHANDFTRARRWWQTIIEKYAELQQIRARFEKMEQNSHILLERHGYRLGAAAAK